MRRGAIPGQGLAPATLVGTAVPHFVADQENVDFAASAGSEINVIGRMAPMTGIW